MYIIAIHLWNVCMPFEPINFFKEPKYYMCLLNVLWVFSCLCIMESIDLSDSCFENFQFPIDSWLFEDLHLL